MKLTAFTPVVTNLWRVKMENCTAWKSRTARKSPLNLVQTHINGGSPKSGPKGKGVGNFEDEETETSQNTINLGSFEVLSDHGDKVEVDEPTNENTEMMAPLPPDSWFKRTETFCGKFRKLCNEYHQDAEDPFLDC